LTRQLVQGPARECLHRPLTLVRRPHGGRLRTWHDSDVGDTAAVSGAMMLKGMAVNGGYRAAAVRARRNRPPSDSAFCLLSIVSMLW